MNGISVGDRIPEFRVGTLLLRVPDAADELMSRDDVKRVSSRSKALSFCRSMHGDNELLVVLLDLLMLWERCDWKLLTDLELQSSSHPMKFAGISSGGTLMVKNRSRSGLPPPSTETGNDTEGC
jgi:hypothetical protein